MKLNSLNDLEARVKNAITEALPTIKLPSCLGLTSINIDVIEVTNLGDEGRDYIIGSVEANVTLRRRS